MWELSYVALIFSRHVPPSVEVKSSFNECFCFLAICLDFINLHSTQISLPLTVFLLCIPVCVHVWVRVSQGKYVCL